MGTGLNGPVGPIQYDSIGNSVFAGGEFTQTGTKAVEYVARWDLNGNSWEPLGKGLDGPAWAIALSGRDVYVGGDFTTAYDSSGEAVQTGGLAKWDGNIWSKAFNYQPREVVSMRLIGNVLYVGASSGASGEDSCEIVEISLNTGALRSIARANGTIRTMSMHGTSLFVGGEFTRIANKDIRYLAEWNRSENSWNAIGELANDDVVDNGTVIERSSVDMISIIDPYLYISGRVLINQGNNVFAWNGKYDFRTRMWSEIPGAPSSINAMVPWNNHILVGGAFPSAGDVDASNIAEYDPNTGTWSNVGGLCSPQEGVTAVYSLAKTNQGIVVGGRFSRIP
jgi:hypothetical protein